MARRLVTLLIACGVTAIAQSTPLRAADEIGGFLESSSRRDVNININLAGTERVERWDSPDGSHWVLLTKPGSKQQQLARIYKIGQIEYQSDYFVGPFDRNCLGSECKRIACATGAEAPDYLCAVNDIAFDDAGRLWIVGASFKSGVRARGFVTVFDPAAETSAVFTKAIDGFEISFQKVVRHEASGNFVLTGFNFSSFDNEERVIVGRVTPDRFARPTADTAFDGDGFAVIDLGYATQATDLLANPDGSVDVLAYTKFTRDATELSVVRRLTSAGKADKTFGLGGSAYPYGLAESSPINLAPGPNSLYVLVKTWDAANNYYVPRLTRLTSSGSYDTAFSGDGKTDFLPFTRRTADIAENYSITSTPVSVMLVRYLSTAPSLLQLYRLTATGEVDPTFGCCTSVGWNEISLNNRTLWRDVDVVDDLRRIYVRTLIADPLGFSAETQDLVLYSKTTAAITENPSAPAPTAGSSTTVAGQNSSSGSAAPSGGSTAGGNSSTTQSVGSAANLAVRPVPRGLMVKWGASPTVGAGYLVTAAYDDEIKQCQVVAGAAMTCAFRNLAPWKTYQVSVAAVVGGVLSEGIKATAKPIIAMKPATTIKSERLIRPPRSPQLGKRSWSARGQCRLNASGTILVASVKPGVCVVTLITAKSGKLPRITRSVTVKVGK